MTKALTFAATGHRPSKLGGYSRDVKIKTLEVALEIVTSFVKPNEIVISGMAQGWDQAIATACYMTNRYWIAAIPFKGQELRWSEWDQKCYHEILAEADEVHYVSSGGYSADKMHKRNIWMMDRADVVLSLYNGSPGGTEQALLYADAKGLHEIEAWSYFSAWELL